MSSSISVLDVVALLTDFPQRSLVQGQVGTVVAKLTDDTFEVEFIDDEGRTYAEAPVGEESLLALHYRPMHAA